MLSNLLIIFSLFLSKPPSYSRCNSQASVSSSFALTEMAENNFYKFFGYQIIIVFSIENLVKLNIFHKISPIKSNLFLYTSLFCLYTRRFTLTRLVPAHLATVQDIHFSSLKILIIQVQPTVQEPQLILHNIFIWLAVFFRLCHFLWALCSNR